MVSLFSACGRYRRAMRWSTGIRSSKGESATQMSRIERRCTSLGARAVSPHANGTSSELKQAFFACHFEFDEGQLPAIRTMSLAPCSLPRRILLSQLKGSIFQRTKRRSIQQFPVGSKPRAVTGAIPCVLGRIPRHDATQMRANRGTPV